MFGNKLEKIEKLAAKGDAAKIAEYVNDKHDDVRMAAIDALGTCQGDDAFNALVPLYANVETMPEYYADTQARVTSENFYWANRLIGALADVRFHECGRAVEDYQEKIGGMGHKQIHDVDAAVAALPEAEVPSELTRANEAFAERVRVETDALLGKVLYTTSCAMKNSFAMNDNVR